MIIERLNLQAFGRFTDEVLDLSAGPRRFHLVYGPNESGKSTCLRAISALLFGVSEKTKDNYLHANTKMRIGATLVNESGMRLDVVRRKGRKSTLRYAESDEPVDPALMTTMLGGIDEAAFHHRFGLSHEQLVAGGKAVLASKGELGEILFAAGAGVGRLRAIQAELENEFTSLFKEKGQKQTINLLLKELDEKRKTLRELQTPTSEYLSLKKQLEESEQQSKALADQIADSRRALSKQKAFRDARQIVPIWRREQARLADLADVPTLDEEFAARRREAAANRDTFKNLVDRTRLEIVEAEDRITACPVDPAVIDHEPEIVSLFKAVSQQEAASGLRSKLHRDVENCNRHLRELLRDLEIEVIDNAPISDIDQIVAGLHVSDAAQIRIAELAGDSEMLRQQEQDALETLRSLRKQLAEAEDELERNPFACDPSAIDSVLNDVGAPAVMLDQVDQEQLACRELESECDRLLGQLRLSGASLATAARLQPPDPSEIDDHDRRLADCQRQIDNAQSALKQLQQQRQLACDNLAKLDSGQRLPTEEELSEARNRRDELVDQIDGEHVDEKSLRSNVRAVRKSIRSADDVVDTMRVHHAQVAKRESVTREIDRLDDSIKTAENEVVQSHKQLEGASFMWNELWESRQIPTGKVREMRTWVATHVSLVDRFSQLESRVTGWNLTRIESSEALHVLPRALAAHGPPDPSRPVLRRRWHHLTVI